MKRGPFIVLLIVLAVVGYGWVRLLALRFERGDIYPVYSSMRTDPLGTKALADSLEGNWEVERNFRPLDRLEQGTGTTLLVLGLTPSMPMATAGLEAVQRFARNGGRVVFAYAPTATSPAETILPAGRRAAANRREAARRETKANDAPALRVDLRLPHQFWGAGLRHQPLAPSAKAFLEAEYARGAEQVPPAEVGVHTTLGFEVEPAIWRTVYHRPVRDSNRLATVVERTAGRGTVVLAADAFAFSNEALRNERQTALLLWMLGGNRRIIFDESHLGVVERPGVAALARRYRLHGLAAALLVLALLCGWRQGTSFLPPREVGGGNDGQTTVAGRDSATGFENLLRRSIPEEQILKVCLEEWKAHGGPGGAPDPGRLARMQPIIDEYNALPPARRDPVQTYRRLSAILARPQPQRWNVTESPRVPLASGR